MKRIIDVSGETTNTSVRIELKSTVFNFNYCSRERIRHSISHQENYAVSSFLQVRTLQTLAIVKDRSKTHIESQINTIKLKSVGTGDLSTSNHQVNRNELIEERKAPFINKFGLKIFKEDTEGSQSLMLQTDRILLNLLPPPNQTKYRPNKICVQ